MTEPFSPSYARAMATNAAREIKRRLEDADDSNDDDAVTRALRGSVIAVAAALQLIVEADTIEEWSDVANYRDDTADQRRNLYGTGRF